MNAILVIDKPAGMTSHDVVARVRQLTGEKSVGHLGTLDPMATGVLPCLLGKYTRLAQFFSHDEKVYAGVMQLGSATDTYDREGDVTHAAEVPTICLSRMRAVFQRFKGDLEQIPPAYSAKKVHGVPAYKHARKGEPVELRPVRVQVHGLEVLRLEEHDRVRFRAHVGPGTYIRTLVHDIGLELGCYAHLAELRRVRAGEFEIDQAWTLATLEEFCAYETLRPAVGSDRVLRRMPAVVATNDQMARIRHGNSVNLAEFSSAEMVKVLDAGADLVCIARRVAGTLFQPKVVLL